MAALDFPNAPTQSQIFHGPNNLTWMWDGAKWIAGPQVPPVLPTSPTGLPTGAQWNNGGFVCVVQ